MTVEQSNAMPLEQVLAEYQKARARLAPAELRFSEFNGLQLTAYMKKNNLMPPTADNFYKAIGVLFETLEWDRKPEKLLLIEKRNAPAVLENPLKLEAEKAAKVKASEAATAKEKATEASIRQARLLIENYRPTKLALGNSRIDNAEIEAYAPHWTKALDAAIANKQDIAKFVLALSATIQKRYADRERAVERGR